jgi:hypothetical protein
LAECFDIDRQALSRFLAWWTKRSDYLAALANRQPRRNLDGFGVETSARL